MRKILRDETMQSNLKNLYPVGEGAGYAGGIVSSAVDGIRVAQKIVQRMSNWLHTCCRLEQSGANLYKVPRTKLPSVPCSA